MIIRSDDFINEDMRLEVGDKFLVRVKNHLSENDDADKLNGQWLTVRRVEEIKRKVTTMESGELFAYKHHAKKDAKIEEAAGHSTTCFFCWFDMEAVETSAVPVGYQAYSFKQKNTALPEA